MQISPHPSFIQALMSNPSPWVGGILGGLLTGGVFGWITHLRNTRPILIFIRRPDDTWRLKNIGKGSAFDVIFKDDNGRGNSSSYIMYPLADGEDVPLGILQYGDTLTVHYKGWFRPWRYSTTCNKWNNKVSLALTRPSTDGLVDETRLNRPAPSMPAVRVYKSGDDS